jgi:N4-(beta-N-acetylglucosaminyl)-L-asparaginase
MKAMNAQITRRKFVATAGIGALAGPSLAGLAESRAAEQAPQAIARGAVKPVVISSANGNRSKDAEGLTCVARAFKMITAGADVLDAVVAGVNIVELDPEDTSVGYGGLPNADGVVQLDSSVMHGPLKRAGAVGCLEGVRTPSLVAKAVMQQTDHVLLVGKGAQNFARSVGFKIERDLNTEKSRRLWLEWKRRTDPDHYLDPKKRAEAGSRAGFAMMAEGLIEPGHYYGTINCDGINAKGEVCGVTTTSGLAFKIPGRVGDSPIIGAGLYVDGDIGAAGSTGRGESNLLSLGSLLVVEAMRKGMAPKDAGMEALKRVAAMTVEKRLLNDRGHPNFQLNYYMLNVKGEYAGVSFYASRYAVCTEAGPQHLDAEPLFSGPPPN